MAAGGESQRELLRAADAFRRNGEEATEQVRDRLDAILARLFRLAFEIIWKGDVFAPVYLAVLDPDELQIVGQQNVVRQRLVATDLIGLENLIEVFANGLVLDITEDHRRLHHFEVRCAGPCNLFRFMDDTDASTGGLSCCLQENLQRASVRVFGLVAAVLPKRVQIVLKNILHGKGPCSGIPRQLKIARARKINSIEILRSRQLILPNRHSPPGRRESYLFDAIARAGA